MQFSKSSKLAGRPGCQTRRVGLRVPAAHRIQVHASQSRDDSSTSQDEHSRHLYNICLSDPLSALLAETSYSADKLVQAQRASLL